MPELVFYPHHSDPEIEVAVTESNVIFRFKDSKVLGRNAWTDPNPPFKPDAGPIHYNPLTDKNG